MRALLQRVQYADVTVDGQIVGAIDRGILTLIGIIDSDTDDDIQWLRKKIVQARIFDDEHGVMNLSVRDVDAEILAVSQFTLYASTRKGNRPSYAAAARPEFAEPFFARFVEQLAQTLGKNIPTGIFGANMKVRLCNDGPVTLWLDSKARE